jgi:hypothetical protein
MGEGGVDYFQSRVIFHTHIAKAAGTSLAVALQELFGRDRVHDTREPGNALPAALSREQRSKIRALTGHFHYGHHDSLFERRKIYLASVREPVARFVSFYRYVIDRPGHATHRAIAGMDAFSAAQALIASKDPIIENQMCRTLGLLKHPLGKQVLFDFEPYLEPRYAILAPQERINDLIAELYRIFGATPPGAIRSNAATGNPVEIDRRTRELVLAHNRHDAALYEYACSRFDRWLPRLHERMELDRKSRTGLAHRGKDLYLRFLDRITP